jgi:hypothetical protein
MSLPLPTATELFRPVTEAELQARFSAEFCGTIVAAARLLCPLREQGLDWVVVTRHGATVWFGSEERLAASMARGFAGSLREAADLAGEAQRKLEGVRLPQPEEAVLT